MRGSVTMYRPKKRVAGSTTARKRTFESTVALTSRCTAATARLNATKNPRGTRHARGVRINRTAPSPSIKVLAERSDGSPPGGGETKEHASKDHTGDRGVQERVAPVAERVSDRDRRKCGGTREHEGDDGGEDEGEEQPRDQGGVGKSESRVAGDLEGEIREDRDQGQHD